MNFKIEKLPQSRIQCTVEIPPDQRSKAEDDALRRMGSSLRIDGFRPGKAPAEKVRERLSTDELLQQTVRALLPDLVQRAMEEAKAQPILPPRIQIAAESPLTISIVFIERPPVAVKADKITVSKRTEPTVEAKGLDQVMHQLLLRFATQKPAERPVADGDMVAVELKTVDADGKEVAELTEANYRVLLGADEELIPGLKNALIGAKKDEKKTLKVAFPKDYPHAPKLQGKTANTTVQVKGITEVRLPELTTEFIKTKLGQDRTPDQFKMDVEGMVKAQKTERQNQQREEEFFAKVREHTKVDIAPELREEEVKSMVEDLQQRLKAQNLTIEQWMQSMGKQAKDVVAEMNKIADDRLILRFGLSELVKIKKIDVTAEEMLPAIEQAARQTSEAHGHAHSPDEWKPGNDKYEQLQWSLKVEKLKKMYLA